MLPPVLAADLSPLDKSQMHAAALMAISLAQCRAQKQLQGTYGRAATPVTRVKC